MISVSAGFTTAMKASAKEVKSYVYDGSSYIRSADDLKYLKISGNGDLLRTVMRQLDFHYFGTHNVLGSSVHPGIGVVLADDGVEYIDYGSFTVTEVEDDKNLDYSKAKAFDKMYESLRKYEYVTGNYPMSLLAFLQAVCDKLGWTLATTSFLNDDLEIDADPFVLLNDITFRQVLEQIAEATCTVMYFDKDDELVLKTASGSSDDTLAAADLFRLNVKPIWGPVDSVVIARIPSPVYEWAYDGGYQHPNILLQSGDALLSQSGDNLLLQALDLISGSIQVRIENNLLLDGDKTTEITDVSGALTGVSFYPFDAKTVGLGYFEYGDRITLTDRNGSTYEALVFNIELEHSERGLIERLFSEVPKKSPLEQKTVAGYADEIASKSQLDGAYNLKDNSVTSAKIQSLSADKITAGTISVQTQVGSASGLRRTVIDGETNSIRVYDDAGYNSILIGDE
jgi:hypothetical protein